jgi:hypothetical protein
MARNPTDYGDLNTLADRLERWRRRHGGRGRRIPSELWQEAAYAARGFGAEAVARALRVRRERLEAALERLEFEAADAEGSTEFVEIHLPATTVSSPDERRRRCPSIVVQFEAADARRLRLEVPGNASCDVGGIFSAFREDIS